MTGGGQGRWKDGCGGARLCRAGLRVPVGTAVSPELVVGYSV